MTRAPRPPHRRISRHVPVLMTATGLILIAASTVSHQKVVLWNATSSVPRGLYMVSREISLVPGTLLVVHLPEPVAHLASQRGYLPTGIPLIKPVAAGPKAAVCRRGDTIFVNGKARGVAKAVDLNGRPLPVWQGCHRLRNDEVFLMNAQNPDSFDGRYFGPIPTQNILGTAHPLLTEEPSLAPAAFPTHR